MEMHQIRYFLSVCETENFTRAAHSACVSQPSLTQAINKLEDELGGKLFIRDRGGCRMTDLGRLVEPNLREIHNHSLALKADAVRFMRLKKIPLRIGLMSSIGSRRLAPLLSRFQKEHPLVEVEIMVEPESMLLNLLQSDAIDVAIIASSKSHGSTYISHNLYKERYGVAFPMTHRFHKMQKIGLQDIQREPYLDRLNCEMRENLKTICSNRDVELYATYRSNSEDWILHMVREGIGIAIIPEHTLPVNADGIDFRYLDDPPLDRQVAAISVSGRPQKTELTSLIHLLGLEK